MKRERNHIALLMRLEGYSYKYIGQKLGISRQRVQKIISPPRELRNLLVERMSGKCQECGLYVGKSGHIHHSGNNGEENYNSTENLEFLCLSCHRKKHKGDVSLPPYMKYESITKTTRNLAIVKLRKADTDLSLEDIGKLFGISKARVCAILKRYKSKPS